MVVYKRYEKFAIRGMSNLVTRRSLKVSHLTRLPSKAFGPHALRQNAELSCPNSPAIKKTYRLVVLGTVKTGKSAIVSRFLGEDFDGRYIPTIENFHRKIYKSRGELYQLDIMDRSGNDPFPAARRLAYMNGDLFLLVGSFDNAQSVMQLLEIYNQIAECKSIWPSSSSHDHDKLNALFVLNKDDLPPEKKEIVLEEAQVILKDVLLTPDHLIVCSAATNENIAKVFGRIFTFAKLPKFMNPELSKSLRTELSEDGMIDRDRPQSLKSVLSNPLHKVIPFSKGTHEEVIVNKNVRRPSLRTDLLVSRAKSCSFLLGHHSKPAIPLPPTGATATTNTPSTSAYRSICYSDSTGKKKRRSSSKLNAKPKLDQPVEQRTEEDRKIYEPDRPDPSQIVRSEQRQNEGTAQVPAASHAIINSIVNSTKRCVIS